MLGEVWPTYTPTEMEMKKDNCKPQVRRGKKLTKSNTKSYGILALHHLNKGHCVGEGFGIWKLYEQPCCFFRHCHHLKMLLLPFNALGDAVPEGARICRGMV